VDRVCRQYGEEVTQLILKIVASIVLLYVIVQLPVPPLVQTAIAGGCGILLSKA
jgi:hypothetical protein